MNTAGNTVYEIGPRAAEPISEAVHEATLHAECPVVAKETVPVERVTIGTKTAIE